MKVLFAVSNENISESIVKKYQKEYKEIISYKNVYYFNAILKEIQRDKTYDRIVISEDLEPFANNDYEAIDRFIFDKLDSISDEATDTEGADTPIILISSDRRAKGEQFLLKIFSIGVYSALLGQDRSIEEVCKLIRKPRTKKEAKIYYKIESEDANYQEENENTVSEIEIQNIRAHYKKLGKNEDAYVDSFNSIATQYTDSQLKVIVKFLPLNVKAVLETKSPKYQEIMSFSRKTVQKPIKEEKKEEAIKIDFIENQLNKPKMTKPVIVPSAINARKVTKLNRQEQQPQEILGQANQRQNMAERIMPRQEIRNEMSNYNMQDNIQKNNTKQEVSLQDLLDDELTRPEEINNIQQEKRTQEQFTNARTLLEEQLQIGNQENELELKGTVQSSLKSDSQLGASKEENAPNIQPPKRGRGRPKKIVDENAEPKPATAKRGRGRPRKVVPQEVTSVENSINLFDIENEETKQTILPELEENVLPGFEETMESKLNNVLPSFEEEINNEEKFYGQENVNRNQTDYENQRNNGQYVNKQINNRNIYNSNQMNGDQTYVEDQMYDEEYANSQINGNQTYVENQMYDEEYANNQMNGNQTYVEDQMYDEEYANNQINGNQTYVEDQMYDEEYANSQMNGNQAYSENQMYVSQEYNDSSMNGNPSYSNQYNNQSYNNEYNNINQNSREIVNTNNIVQSINIESLLTNEKKIVSFVGTTKNGTSFLVNTLGEHLSLMGIKTAILDVTKNKNSYYIYTKNEENLRKIAMDCMDKLAVGETAGIQVNKDLTVYTSLPLTEGEEENQNCEEILKTLVKNYSLVLLDCDFGTDMAYFSSSQEIYFVQSMDILTIQPLTAFLRELKAKNILLQEKIRVVINKQARIKSLNPKIIIGGMSFYNEPSMSFMTELFNKDNVKYCTIPFEEQVYAKYLEGLVNCKISLSGYPKNFMNALKELGNMVYPLLSNKYRPVDDYNKKRRK